MFFDDGGAARFDQGLISAYSWVRAGTAVTPDFECADARGAQASRATCCGFRQPRDGSIGCSATPLPWSRNGNAPLPTRNAWQTCDTTCIGPRWARPRSVRSSSSRCCVREKANNSTLRPNCAATSRPKYRPRGTASSSGRHDAARTLPGERGRTSSSSCSRRQGTAHQAIGGAIRTRPCPLSRGTRRAPRPRSGEEHVTMPR